jgi:hypothetical protein
MAVREERIAATERDLADVTAAIEQAPDDVSADVPPDPACRPHAGAHATARRGRGVRALGEQTTGGVRLAGTPSEPTQGAPNSVKILSAIIVGLIVALGVGLVRNRFDRRIYSVSDVAFVAPGVEVLGVVASSAGSSPGADLAGRSVRRAATRAGAGRLLLVPMSSTTAAQVVADAVLRGAATDVIDVGVVQPVRSGQQAFVDATEADHVVLLVSVGRDTSPDVQRALRQFG